MAKRYVDNAYNRSVGRVGNNIGSAIVSRSGVRSNSKGSYWGSDTGSSSGSGFYVDNAFNRSAGRVGLEKGTRLLSKSNDSLLKSKNGSHSGSHSDSSSASGVYVDNDFNRNVGRVGIKKGTFVLTKTSDSVSKSKNNNSVHKYIDNDFNRSVGRVGLEKGSVVISKSSENVSIPKNTKNTIRIYVDNPYNRRIGRVGQPIKSGAKNSNKTIVKKRVDVYVDNALNRKLGRVGKEKRSDIRSDTSNARNKKSLVFNPFKYNDFETEGIDLFLDHIMAEKEKAVNDYEYSIACERAEGIVNRYMAAHDMKSVPKQIDFELKTGDVIDYKELELGDKIGGGGFGDVYIAILRGEFLVAVKKLRVGRIRKDKKEEFEREIKLLSTLKHYAIVDFYGACIETPNLAIVMEFMSVGSLYDIIHIEVKQLMDRQKYQMIADSFSALEYLHNKSISHRDIKSRNILVCDDFNHCKLADFGLALKNDNHLSSSVKHFSVVGTYRYSPPEVLNGNRLTIDGFMRADIYSNALTMIEMITEKEPFDGYNDIELRKAVLDGHKPHFESGLVSHYLENLLKSCLNTCPKQRPSAKHFLNLFLNFFSNILKLI